MQTKPTITLRNTPPSKALEDHIMKKVEKLNRFHHNITHCDVVVDFAQNSKHQGKLYNTRIDLKVPGGKLVSNHAISEDVYVSVRDAFKALQRQIQSVTLQQRGQTKSHPVAMHGTITKLFPKDKFGFISANGDEYYFSEMNVAYPEFSSLKISQDVRFLASIDADGLRAVRVTAGKHNSHW